MPPINEATKLRYDSVNWAPPNENIYTVYANKKAYPEYLITYQ